MLRVLLLFTQAVVAMAHDPLGPGASTTWPLTDPSEIGLSANALADATLAVGDVGTMMCFAIAVNGALVVDETYLESPFTKGRKRAMESMSAAKTVTSIVMGGAMHDGLFTLDKTLASYGVVPHGANWSDNWNGTNYFPFVTARHLLSQSAGEGRYMPGTALTYDSDNYVQHLSYLLNTTASAALSLTAREYATAFASKLGLPELYSFEGTDPAQRGDTPTAADGGAATEISAGGDQPMTCENMLRFGQLLLNRGQWRGADGTSVRQLLSPDYIDALFSPQDTHVQRYNDTGVCVGTDAGAMCAQYSLLATVTTNNSALINESACSVATSGTVRVLGLPDDSLLALGSMGKYLVVVPSRNMTFVAFGSHIAKFSDCAKRPGGVWISEEGIILSAIMRGIGNAIQPTSSMARRASPAALAPNPVASSPQRPPRAEGTITAAVKPGGTIGGSCYCYCGYNQAIGRCRNMSAGATQAQCTAMRNDTGSRAVFDSYCPRASVLYDCFRLGEHSCPPKFPSSSAPGWILDASRPAAPCANRDPIGPLRDAMRCSYLPTRYDACYFVPKSSCYDSPYFPLTP